MSNLRLSQQRQGIIVLYIHNNKKLTGPQKTID